MTEVPLFDTQQRFLGSARQVLGALATALLAVILERTALVLRRDHREADRGYDEQGDDECAEFDLERPQSGSLVLARSERPSAADSTHSAGVPGAASRA